MHIVFMSLAKNAEQYPVLHDYLLADLKHIRRKQIELIACGIAMLHNGPIAFVIPRERQGQLAQMP